MEIENKVDFKQQEHFPGTVGNPFDIALHKIVELEKVPAIIFAAFLLALAFLPSHGTWPAAVGLWAFILLDWALLAGLPRAGKSFGPVKPVLLVLAVARTVVAFLPLAPAAVLEGIGTLLVIYGFWIEPHRLTLTRQRLTTAKLPPGAKLRLLHLGDLHIERLTDRERKLNQLVAELRPDLILFSGDFLNLSYLHDPAAWEAARAVMKEWKAPLGVYAVTGSPAVDLDEVVPQLLKDLPLHWLRDEKVTLSVNGAPVDVVGVTCTHRPFLDGPRLETTAGSSPKNFSILLYHTPDLAPEAAALGMDLQLSGHTHGGQVRLPFYGAIFAGSLYGKRFEAGRYQVGGLTLYVSRGIGLEGAGAPRVRFLCPPEIILWDIEGQA